MQGRDERRESDPLGGEASPGWDVPQVSGPARSSPRRGRMGCGSPWAGRFPIENQGASLERLRERGANPDPR